MLEAVRAALPADIAIFAAAVADWRVASAGARRRSRRAARARRSLELVENPDILKTVAADRTGKRPPLVIGFAAETENVIEHATRKRKAKGCDWIVANDVSPETGIMGGDRNTVHLITAQGVESWPELDKTEVARRLVARRGRMARRTHGRHMTRKPARHTARIKVVRLPHGEGLALPAYQSEGAAGMDLLAAVARRR